ncbi:MAG TPA: hypothetical protein DCL63_10840 [Firmicutes bacterium]|jgi:uncharacterized membrane protein|nr:hypothetical protein [Bacillota bacterium]HBK59871.1 hypothetical protein [Bacillota bacterium]
MNVSLRDERARGERQVELDIGKGFAVLLMICVHVQEALSHSVVQYSLFGCIVEFVTGFPAAPLFMFVMGVGTVYSRRQDAGYAIGRGASLLLMAYLLNAARGYIPWALGIKLGFLAQDAVPYGDVLQSLLEVDILHFAGLCFILIGVLRAAKVPWGAYPVVGLVLGGLNYLVCGISTGQAYADSILGLLWGASETSYFPFLSWVMYPMAGIAFGHILKNSSDRRRLYMQSLLAGCAVLLIAMCVSGFRFMYYMGFPEENAYVYYHQDLIANAVNGSLALIWLSVLYFVSGSFPAAVRDKLLYWSKELTPIYVIHWVLIGWLALLIGFNQLMFWQTILAMAIIVVAADRITAAYADWRGRSAASGQR